MSFTNYLRLGAAMVATLLVLLASPGAIAQEEFPPPSGKGRVVVMASGATGIPNYRDVARRIAALGYDVVLFDANNWAGTQDRGLRDAIAQAQRMPHALPGKVGLVGFSLGGGYVLGYGTAWSDQVAVVAAWYPSTTPFKDPPAWAGRDPLRDRCKMMTTEPTTRAAPSPSCQVRRSPRITIPARTATTGLT